MKKTVLVLGTLILVLAAADAFGRGPQWGGLSTIAVSPDGKMLVAGGQSRVLYVLDAATMEVKNRIWTEARIGFVAFNKDGTRLVLETDEPGLRLYDTSTWKPVGRVDKADWTSTAPAADLMAAIQDEWEKSTIHFISMTTLAAAGSVEFKGRAAAFALDAEGKKLAVLTEYKEEGEKKAEDKDKPENLEGLAASEWDQKNDGYTCKLLLFEVPSGKPLGSFDLWYTSTSGLGSTDILLDKSFVYVINYYNVCAKIDEKGAVALFETKNSYNYGRGISADRKFILTGGMRDGTYTTVEGMKMVQFETDTLPGWPEYFESFAFAADGTAFGVTSGFRIVKITKEGRMEKASPLY